MIFFHSSICKTISLNVDICLHLLVKVQNEDELSHLSARTASIAFSRTVLPLYYIFKFRLLYCYHFFERVTFAFFDDMFSKAIFTISKKRYQSSNLNFFKCSPSGNIVQSFNCFICNLIFKKVSIGISG